MKFGYISTNRTLKRSVNMPIYLRGDDISDMEEEFYLTDKMRNYKAIELFNLNHDIEGFVFGSNFLPHKTPTAVAKEAVGRRIANKYTSPNAYFEVKLFSRRRNKKRDFDYAMYATRLAKIFGDIVPTIACIGEMEYTKAETLKSLRWSIPRGTLFLKPSSKYWKIEDLLSLGYGVVPDTRYNSVDDIIANMKNDWEPTLIYYSTSIHQKIDYMPDFDGLKRIVEEYEEHFGKLFQGMVIIDSGSREAAVLEAKRIFGRM